MSWRFALTPKWLVRHVLVIALVVTMVYLAFWQLRRLDQKQTYRDLVAARQEQPVMDVESVVPAGAALDSAAVDAVLYRSVRAVGSYASDDTVVVRNRTFNGAPGAWVLTPLRLDDGTGVVINRGFIGFDRAGAIVAPPPPAGRVTVDGLVYPSQRRGSFGPTDASHGRLRELARVDLERYAAQLDYDLLPAYLQLVATDPAERAVRPGEPQLVALGAPKPDLGPHLSYAVQWFIFTTIAAGGYVILLRRVARDEGRLRAAP